MTDASVFKVTPSRQAVYPCAADAPRGQRFIMQHFPEDMELTDITEGQAQEAVKRQL
jgi:hypothetical protein